LHAGVYGDDAVFVYEQRIDIELANFRMSNDKVAGAHQNVNKIVEFCRRSVAVPGEETWDMGFGNYLTRKKPVERRQPEGTVSHDFDGHTACPKEHHWPERLIDVHPDDDFNGVRPVDHRFHGKAVYPGMGTHTLDVVDHF